MKRGFTLFLIAALLCTGSTASADVFLSGDIGFYFRRKRMEIFIEEIVNLGPQTTDRLRLRVFASEHPWHPRRPGRLLAFSLLPRLYSGEDRDDNHLSRPLNRPSDDDWYVTFVLEQRFFDANGRAYWVIEDIVIFDDVWIEDGNFFPWD